MERVGRLWFLSSCSSLRNHFRLASLSASASASASASPPWHHLTRSVSSLVAKAVATPSIHVSPDFSGAHDDAVEKLGFQKVSEEFIGECKSRSTVLRSATAHHRRGAVTITDPHLSNALPHHTAPPSFHFHRTFFSLSPSTNRAGSDFFGAHDDAVDKLKFQEVLEEFFATCYKPPLMVGGIRSFCEDTTHFPVITDPDVLYVFKDIMAASWDELPDAVISDAKKALAKNTEDKAGQEALANLFRAAEAAEEFGGILVSLRMAIDDSVGLSGENVKPIPDEFANALQVVYKRYTEYLGAFGPEEVCLRKKVETELGTKMIHLKMRCSSLGSEWGKVTVLGTSGLSGSYVEQRAS